MHRLIAYFIAASTLSLVPAVRGQIVITEIMYHPQSVTSPNDVDWVEIYNDSDAPVDLEDWQLFDQDFLISGKDPTQAPEPFGADVFHGGVKDGSSTLVPHEVAVIINGRFGEDSISNFRIRWSLPDSVKIIAPLWGGKFDMVAEPSGTYFPEPINKNSSDSAEPEWIMIANAAGTIIDVVDYRNGFSEPRSGWPDAGGVIRPGQPIGPNGGSIYLKTAAILGGNAEVANNTGSNWSISVSGEEGAYNQNKFFYAPYTYSDKDVGSPGVIWGVPTAAIPEPSSLAFLMGVSVLLSIRRRR